MMRRTFRAMEQKFSANLPIYSILMRVRPGDVHAWGKHMAVMHENHILSAGCWQELSDHQKNNLPIPDDLRADITEAVAEGLGTAKGKRVAILFASQTGTSESYAKMLGTYAVAHGLVPVVTSMNEGAQLFTNPNNLPNSVIFVCSTYGVGEFPSNGQDFWKKLQAGQLNQLRKVPYTILGLGNSHNDNFNAAAKALNSRLKSLGAKSFLRMQLSCELQPNGHDAVFRGWKRSIWPALGKTTAGVTPTAVYAINEVFGVQHTVDHMLPAHRKLLPATVRQNEQLSSKDYAPTSRLLTVSMPTANQRELLGGLLKGRQAEISDHIEIVPFNNDATVARALKRLNVAGDMVVEITPLPGAPASYFDGRKCTVKQLLTDVVDLSCIPSRSMLESLAGVATDDAEKAKLLDLADNLSAGSDYDKLTSGVFSVMDVLEMFPSVKLNLSQLMTYAPHIAPRTYSIANDHTNMRHEDFQILYTTPTRTVDGRSHTGLCSGMLDNLRAGDSVNMKFVPSTVPLPRDDVDTIIIALGTGIGSARAILQQRLRLKQAGEQVGACRLYYGFRHAADDCFFKEEFDAMEAAGVVRVTYVASHDQAEFITPMDKLPETTGEFIGSTGEIYYCGLGGSVPVQVESALTRVGVDVAELRATGRYHEEYFTADLDMENMLKAHSGANAASTTLAGRMGKCDMFCFQCEQTFKGTGCHKVGVCGKTPRVAALQDLTVHASKVLGFYANELRQMGVVMNDVNRLTLFSLFATLTNVNFDESRFVTILRDIKTATNQAKAAYEAECKKAGKTPATPKCVTLPSSLPDVDGLVALGKNVGVLTRFTDPKNQNAAGVSEMLMYGLKGLAAYTDHSLMNGKEDPEIYAFIHKALAFLISPDQFDLGKGLELCLEAGKVNVSAMAMLYDSNKTLGVPKPTQVPVKPVPGKAILVSGHDLIILDKLLPLAAARGINVYTHGEMLPAHSYEKLKAKNLIGNFGGAWMRQAVEFPHFPGPVLMTTNCLIEPHESYAARIFTAGAVGWKGVPHIGNNIEDINFDALLDAAEKAPGFTEADKEFSYADPVGVKRPDALTVGFGHETILSVAPTIIEEITKGNITRFFVVGGCDGFEGDRSYYTDLVAKLPKTAVVLTVGCGKYRINHLDLGTIGDTGIPRILDMGQCNDSFSAVQVALALADVLKCKVSDLPLSIVLSWFEQKAVAVLLSCISLGLKPIHVGPALPAFITPDVLDVLVKDFGIRALGDVDEDLKTMLAATGAS